MTNGDLAMELLAALGGFEVVRPEMQESTALGSALRCSLHPLLVCLDGTLRARPETLERSTLFTPHTTSQERSRAWCGWQRVVERSRGWIELEE